MYNNNTLSNTTGCKRKCYGTLSIWAIILFVVFASIGAFLKVWIPLIFLDTEQKLVAQEGPVVVLQDLDHFYHHNVHVKTSAKGSYNVDIYHLQTSCHNLKMTTNHKNVAGNFTNLYLMPHSVIEYGMYNVNTQIDAYVASGLVNTSNTFNPSNLQIVQHNPNKIENEYSVKQWNYYSIFFGSSFTDLQSIAYANFTVFNIDVNSLKNDDLVCTLNESNHNCIVDLTFRAVKSCLVADIHGSVNGSSFDSTQVEFDSTIKLWKEWDIGLFLSVLFVLIVVLVIVAVCISCCCCCRCDKQSNVIYVDPDTLPQPTPGTV